MSAPRPVAPAVPHWKKLYEDAILEVDLPKIPERVDEARKAIQTALVELITQGNSEDCKRLVNCLNVLDLLKMYGTQRTHSADQ